MIALSLDFTAAYVSWLVYIAVQNNSYVDSFIMKLKD